MPVNTAGVLAKVVKSIFMIDEKKLKFVSGMG